MAANDIIMAASGGSTAANYIEDVFSTYLYTGNGSTQTITNGIDLAGKGGLVWAKCRSGAYSHMLQDTVRGSYKYIQSDNTVGQNTNPLFDWFKSFNSDGFTVAYTPSYGPVLNDPILNASGQTYTSWTFRKQPKFFDVVTYTGTGASSQTISHSLASVPGFIAIKRTDSTGDWVVIARSSSNGQYYCLQNATTPFGFNSTNAAFGTVDFAGMGYLSSTTFLPYVFGGGNSSSSGTNISGATYVAYLFAHNAGGFGLTGTDNVISCGSFLTDSGGNATVTLGYEPQFVMWKAASTTGGWNMLDTMRGFTVGGSDGLLSANSTSAETSIDLGFPTATGFTAAVAGTNATYIYIAIRRGPMKVPTDATKVFNALAYTGTGATATVSTTVRPDLLAVENLSGFNSNNSGFWDRLRGFTAYLSDTSASAENTAVTTSVQSLNNTTVGVGADGSARVNSSGRNYSYLSFTRAPTFFDEVCYTGTGAAGTVTHNLAAVPELMIVKLRNGSNNWVVYASALGNTSYLYFNTLDLANSGASFWNSTTPTSSVFSVGSGPGVNGAGSTYVAWLFATCAGVSKVGSFTRTSGSQTIDCGFAAGARFVLVKRTDANQNWFQWDAGQGMVSGNSPYMQFNTISAQTTGDNGMYTSSTGFTVGPASPLVTGGSYIYLAIA